MKERSGRLARWAGVVLVIVALLAPGAGTLRAQEAAGQAVPPGALAAGGVELAGGVADVVDVPAPDHSAYPRLESELAALYESAVLGTGRPIGTFAGQRHIDLAAGTAQVILDMETDPQAHPVGPPLAESVTLEDGRQVVVQHAATVAIRADLATGIAAAGAIYQTAFQGWVQVLAPFRSLPALGEVTGVRLVRLPFPAQQQEIRPTTGATSSAAKAGTVNSEGVSLTNAGTWHAGGRDGSGVNLAVFDFGFTNWAARISEGNLPAGTVLHDYSASFDFASNTAGYTHGTACAEIAYDMAPGSWVHLYAWNTEAEFGNALTHYETGVSGPKVASMSVTWVNAGPYDGTGSIDTLINTASTTHSILWANSAGNFQTQHYSWTSARYAGGDSVAFGTGNIEGIGPSSGYLWNIASGTVLRIYLEWNDWNSGRTGDENNYDYDLYLYRWTGSSWTYVTSSAGNQCSASVPPTEGIAYTVPSGGPYNYGIVIWQDTGCANPFGHWMQLYTLNGFYQSGSGAVNSFWYVNNCNSVAIPAEADGAVPVGATFWNEDGLSPLYGLETFSSLGPRNGSGGTNPGTAVNMPYLVVAPDGVSTSTGGASSGVSYANGGTGFWGTSSAAPHVAGLAATAWSGNPTYTLTNLKEYVKGQALYKAGGGSCGGSLAGGTESGTENNRYGWGRIHLGATPVKTWTGAVSTDWSAAANWAPSGVPVTACADDVVIPTNPSGGRFPTLTNISYVRNLTIQSGASLSGGSTTLNVCRNWNNAGTFTGNTGTVNFAGTTIMSGGSTANNFHNVTIAAGKSLDMANQSLKVSGNWTNSGGRVVPGTSSVSFNAVTSQSANTPGAVTIWSDDFGTDKGWSGYYDGSALSALALWTRGSAKTSSGCTGNQDPGSDYGVSADNSLIGTAIGGCYGNSIFFPALYLSSPPIDTSGVTGVNLTYARFLNNENGQDPAYVGVYNGSTWTDVATVYATDNAWNLVSTGVSAYADNRTGVRVRFGLSSNGTVVYAGWNIDDVSLTGTPSYVAWNHLTVSGDSGSDTATFGNTASVLGNLSIQPGQTMEMGLKKVQSIGGTFTYLDGTLSNYETKAVSDGGSQTFYDGRSVISAVVTDAAGGASLGNTTVTTRIGTTVPSNFGGGSCAAESTSVKRHYNVGAATNTGLNVTLRLYYADAELNGNTESDLFIWHCENTAYGWGWVREIGTYARDTGANWVQVTGVDSFSPFILKYADPTSVILKSFKAFPEAPGIHVRWETSQEIDNRGFNLYRSNTRTGPKTKLNAELIPSKVPPGSPFGAVYDWIDTYRLRSGRGYFYWLEDVDLSGNTTLHGPAKAVAP